MSCCPDHPKPCGLNGVLAYIALAGIAATFGWRWFFLAIFVGCELDWLVRLWKHRSEQV